MKKLFTLIAWLAAAMLVFSACADTSAKDGSIKITDMVVVPLYELPSKALFSQRITLPADKYINNFGFGLEYSVIAK